MVLLVDRACDGNILSSSANDQAGVAKLKCFFLRRKQ